MGGSSSVPKDKAVVVIVGGGYGGVAAAKILDASGDFFVVLIDRKNYFLHNVGSLRACLDDSTATSILIPYGALLKNGVFLQAETTSITAEGVRVHGRDELIKFHYLVIATGSSYAFPAKVAEPKIEQALERYKMFNQKIHAANVKNIVIVGGGSVGIELAGELREYLGADKNITIVHSGAKLIHAEPLKQEFLTGINNQLQAKNIRLELNQRIEPPVQQGDAAALEAHDPLNATGAYWGLGNVVTNTGTSLPCDLLLFTSGARNNVKSLSALSNVMQDERIKVNTFMQVEGYQNIFAVGDIAQGATKRAMYANIQGQIAGKNIVALQKHKVKSAASSSSPSPPKLTPFTPYAGHALLLTFGSQGGMSQFFNSGESVFGTFVTKMLKSKGLFIEKQWGELNQSGLYSKVPKTHDTSLQAGQLTLDVDAAKHAKQVEEAMKILNEDSHHTKEILTTGLPTMQVEPGQQFV